MGIPDFLQLDNELCFCGSNRYPRSFGIVLKLCPLLGIEVVFSPIGEPWRNGAVESFNDTYNRRFFRTQWFVAIITSDLSPSTSSSSITGIIDTVVSEAKHLFSLSKRLAKIQPCHLLSSHCRKSPTFQTEQSFSSVLSEVIQNWISLENTLSFLRALSILMSELRSLRVYIKFRSTQVMTWLLLSHTAYQHGLLRILKMGNLGVDTS
jgi:hypothetical protein